MRLRDIDNKTRCYLAVAAFLFVYVEWVDCIAGWVSDISFLLKGG